MNSDSDDEELELSSQLPAGVKNYITPNGYRKLQEELDHLWKVERPALVKTITWAASNGDRSENGDYIYGKKRLQGNRSPRAIFAQAPGACRGG